MGTWRSPVSRQAPDLLVVGSNPLTISVAHEIPAVPIFINFLIISNYSHLKKLIDLGRDREHIVKLV